MTPEIINMIAQFMSRVNLQATEIDAYQTCMKTLGEEFERLNQEQSGPNLSGSGAVRSGEPSPVAPE